MAFKTADASSVESSLEFVLRLPAESGCLAFGVPEQRSEGLNE